MIYHPCSGDKTADRGVSNHWLIDCLFKGPLRQTTNATALLTPVWEATGDPHKRASDPESVSMS